MCMCLCVTSLAGEEEEILYPEFLNLIAGIAEAMYRTEAPETSILQRIHMMFFYIRNSGTKFQKKEYKLLQDVRRIMKETHE